MSRANAIAEARRLTLARGDALVRLHAHAERFTDLDENLDVPDRDHGLRLLAATVVEAHAHYRIADERHRDQRRRGLVRAFTPGFAALAL
jgi:hypothetical protein